MYALLLSVKVKCAPCARLSAMAGASEEGWHARAETAEEQARLAEAQLRKVRGRVVVTNGVGRVVSDG